jgi:hypothetical protein
MRGSTDHNIAGPNDQLDPGVRAPDLSASALGSAGISAWARVDDEHPRWETGEGDRARLVTDVAIATFGRRHIEQLVASLGLPALPDEAWGAGGPGGQQR